MIDYEQFVEILKSAYHESKKSYVELCQELEFKSPGSIQNAFNIESQKLADQKLTKFASLIGIDCYIIYGDGEKGYLVNDDHLV